MKTLAIMFLLTSAIFYPVTVLLCQTVSDTNMIDDYKELLGSDLKTKKVEMIRRRIALTKAEAESFWPLYKRYDNVLSALNVSNMALIRDYATNSDRMTSAKANELKDRALDLDEKRFLVRKKFYNEFTKVLNARTAAQFLQLDRSFEILMDLQIAAQVSLVK